MTINTVFHRSHLPMQKWFMALLLLLDYGAKISARQLATILQVNKNTACCLKMRIRRAISDQEQRSLVRGIIESAELRITGEFKNEN
ncbi:hypothetical protein [Abditibacterium utsteinense]|uniref:hypothetical protein n=1 Tax=Abditibacterium utsteinense TaxID=1960156 RepID=UPI001EE6ECDA|nr:hypothetical protein [Abditibacterium utsteinense]